MLSYYHRTTANKPAAAKPIPSSYSPRAAALFVADAVGEEPEFEDDPPVTEDIWEDVPEDVPEDVAVLVMETVALELAEEVEEEVGPDDEAHDAELGSVTPFAAQSWSAKVMVATEKVRR